MSRDRLLIDDGEDASLRGSLALVREDASGQTWYTLALKLKFPLLKAGEVVRIRSATVDETSTHKKVLVLSHYSNILVFPHNSKIGKELRSKISDDKADKANLK